jgi:hypothetical protein
LPAPPVAARDALVSALPTTVSVRVAESSDPSMVRPPVLVASSSVNL